MRTAIFIDAGYVRARWRTLTNSGMHYNTDDISSLNLDIIKRLEEDGVNRSIAAIKYFDSIPFMGILEHPHSGKLYDFKKLNQRRIAGFFTFIDKLQENGVEVIKGRMKAIWELNPRHLKKAEEAWREDIEQVIEFDPKEDIVPRFKQVGVDLDLAMHMTKLVFKKEVDEVVLVTGDT